MIISLADYDLTVAAYSSSNLIVIGPDYAAAVLFYYAGKVHLLKLRNLRHFIEFSFRWRSFWVPIVGVFDQKYFWMFKNTVSKYSRLKIQMFVLVSPESSLPWTPDFNRQKSYHISLNYQSYTPWKFH